MVPWSPRVLNPNGISIGSAVFAGLTTVTDILTTDHAAWFVTIGRIYYVRSTAMQPKNNEIELKLKPIRREDAGPSPNP